MPLPQYALTAINASEFRHLVCHTARTFRIKFYSVRIGMNVHWQGLCDANIEPMSAFNCSFYFTTGEVEDGKSIASAENN